VTSSAEEGSDFDGSNASEDEGSVSDFEESDDGRTLLTAPVTLVMILTFELLKARTGMNSRGKLQSVRRTCAP